MTSRALGPAIERARRVGLDPLWDELARRYSASDRPVTAVTLRGLTGDQQVAMADLLALDRLPATTCRVQLNSVAAALGVADAADLRGIVESLRGPIVDRAAARRRSAAERAELWAWFEAGAAALDLADWAESVRSAGVPGGDVAAHRVRLKAALAVLSRVLAQRGGDALVLASLASDVLGDPHALDPGRPVASLVVDALASRRGAGSRRADEVRATWESAGVATDELSSTVIVSGLRPTADDPLAVHLRAMADAGEPATVTLAQLRRWPVAVDSDFLVHAVENPSIVAEAAARGVRSALVCTSGWPNVAVLTLLRQLDACGARLRCHADFDSAGILIVRDLMAAVGAEPWGMTADEYTSALGRSSVRLRASVADTPWDPALAPAMRSHAKAVFEEDVRESLLTKFPG